jgi:DNA polymerase III subunit epsilon
MAANVIVCLDTETTGLDPAKHDIIQLAAVALDAATLVQLDSFGMFIRPARPENADPKALAVNGLSLAWLVEHGQDQAAVAEAFDKWVGQWRRPIPMGYCLPFDLGFLDRLCPISWGRPALDVHALAWSKLKRTGLIPDAKLLTVATFLGISFQAHDAAEDVQATVRVYRELVRPVRNLIADLAEERQERNRLLDALQLAHGREEALRRHVTPDTVAHIEALSADELCRLADERGDRRMAHA